MSVTENVVTWYPENMGVSVQHALHILTPSYSQKVNSLVERASLGAERVSGSSPIIKNYFLFAERLRSFNFGSKMH